MKNNKLHSFLSIFVIILIVFFLTSCQKTTELVDFPESSRVSFYDGDDLVLETNVKRLSYINEPTINHSDSGYYIEGWYLEKECLTQWEFTEGKVKMDTNLYAKWAPLFVYIYNQVIESYEIMMYRSPHYPIDEVTIPETYLGKPVLSLWNGAFQGKHNVPKKINVSKNIERIGELAFAHSHIEEIYIPFDGNLFEVHQSTFWGANIKEINIPNLLEIDPRMNEVLYFNIQFNISENHSLYTEVDDVIYTKDLKTLVYYPSLKLDEMYTILEGTQTIGSYAFYETEVKSVFYPSSLITVMDSAFEFSRIEDFTPLEENSIETLRYRAFYFSSLKHIDISKDVSKIESETFSYSSLETIHFDVESQLSTIDFYAFYNTKMTEIVLPSSLIHINPEAFTRTTIQRVSIGEGMSTQVIDSLRHFYHLEEIIINPSHASYMSKDGIVYSKDETELILVPRNLNQASFHIESDVLDIGPFAFYQHNHIKDLTISPEHPTLSLKDNVVFSKDQTVLVHYSGFLNDMNYAIPEGTIVLGSRSFCEAFVFILELPNSLEIMAEEALMNANIWRIFFKPNGQLKTIEKGAISGTRVMQLILPASIERIESYAIFNNHDLQKIYVLEQIDVIEANAFGAWSYVQIHTNASEPKDTWFFVGDEGVILLTEQQPWA